MIGAAPLAQTGQGVGGTMPRRAIEDALMRRFPSLTRSQANKISRRHRSMEAACAEVLDRQRGFRDGIPAGAYRGQEPTANTAVRNLAGGGGR